MARRACLAAVAALLLSGCGGAALETAHTTPRGTIAVDMATSYVINEHNDERTALANIWPDIGLRYGATDNLDVGVRMLMLGGVTADVKYNLLPSDWDMALAVQGGVGAAADVSTSEAWLLYVPVRFLFSYRFLDRVEPYVSVGYASFWVFGREPFQDAGEDRYAARVGHGDGVVQVSAGLHVTLWTSRRVSGHLAAGYTFWASVLDDPGDFYALVDNHFVGIGYGMGFNTL